MAVLKRWAGVVRGTAGLGSRQVEPDYRQPLFSRQAHGATREFRRSGRKYLFWMGVSHHMEKSPVVRGHLRGKEPQCAHDNAEMERHILIAPDSGGTVMSALGTF